MFQGTGALGERGENTRDGEFALLVNEAVTAVVWGDIMGSSSSEVICVVLRNKME